MLADRTPLAWPASWKSPAVFDLLRNSPINAIVTTDKAMGRQAEEAGFEVINPHSPPRGLTVIEGTLAGIKLDRFGSSTTVSAGPTGEPWVNSNVWSVRLARARTPENTVWIRTQPPDNTGGAAFPYTVMIADVALAGGRWVIALDDPLARAIAEGQSSALATWKKITSTAAYFAGRTYLDAYDPQAVVAIVSGFSTSFEQELLNLVTRSGQQYRVVPDDRLAPTSLKGLRAALFPSAEPPAAPVRQRLLEFVQSGGLLITAAPWPEASGTSPSSDTHPRFTIAKLGQGIIAEPKEPMRDPYLLASDSAILVSHRYDLLRFWNGGAMSAFFTAAPDGKRAAVQLLFYSNRPSEDVAVRIAGPWRTARISTLETPVPAAVHAEQQNGAIEVHLPAIAQYAAIEMEA